MSHKLLCHECGGKMQRRSASGLTWYLRINGDLVTRYIPSSVMLLRCSDCDEVWYGGDDDERIEQAIYDRENKGAWGEKPHKHSVASGAPMSNRLKNMWNRGNAAIKVARARLKLVAQDPKVRQAITIGHEAFNAAAPFIEKPTPWNAAKSAFNFAKTAIVDEISEVYHYDYFEGDEWVVLFSTEFTFNVLAVVGDYPRETVKVADEKLEIRIVTVAGHQVGWVHDVINNEINGSIHVSTYGAEEVRQFVRKLLWEQFGNKSLVMQQRFTIMSSRSQQQTSFEVDDLVRALPSKLATDLIKQTQRFFDKNYSRSYLLYGPPGTGKSTIARTVVDGLGLRSFRIRVEDVSRISKTTLFQAITVFQPDAIIFDDFDRAGSQAELLETLTLFKDRVKLVIATVNDVDRLDDALKRPERFDRHVLVDCMDENVVKAMLGEFADGYESVKDWPIVFINEYVKCRDVMTPEEAALEVTDLARRVEGLENYRDQDDVSRMMSLMKKKEKNAKKAKKNFAAVESAEDLLGTKSKAGSSVSIDKLFESDDEESEDEEDDDDSDDQEDED